MPFRGPALIANENIDGNGNPTGSYAVRTYNPKTKNFKIEVVSRPNTSSSQQESMNNGNNSNNSSNTSSSIIQNGARIYDNRTETINYVDAQDYPDIAEILLNVLDDEYSTGAILQSDILFDDMILALEAEGIPYGLTLEEFLARFAYWDRSGGEINVSLLGNADQNAGQRSNEYFSWTRDLELINGPTNDIKFFDAAGHVTRLLGLGELFGAPLGTFNFLRNSAETNRFADFIGEALMNLNSQVFLMTADTNSPLVLEDGESFVSPFNAIQNPESFNYLADNLSTDLVVDINGYIRNSDGTLVTDQNGEPLNPLLTVPDAFNFDLHMVWTEQAIVDDQITIYQQENPDLWEIVRTDTNRLLNFRDVRPENNFHDSTYPWQLDAGVFVDPFTIVGIDTFMTTSDYSLQAIRWSERVRQDFNISTNNNPDSSEDVSSNELIVGPNWTNDTANVYLSDFAQPDQRRGFGIAYVFQIYGEENGWTSEETYEAYEAYMINSLYWDWNDTQFTTNPPNYIDIDNFNEQNSE